MFLSNLQKSKSKSPKHSPKEKKEKQLKDKKEIFHKHMAGKVLLD